MSGAAIGAKLSPLYAFVFMDRPETKFLEKERLKSLSWLRYIDDIFFVCENKLDEFLKLNIKFTLERSEQ